MGWYYEKGQAGLAGWYTILDTSAAQYITVFEIMSKLLFICTLGCFELRFLHSAPLNPCCSVVSCVVPWAPASSPVVFWFVLSFCTALIFFFFCWQFLLQVFLVLALLDFIYVPAFVSGVWVLFLCQLWHRHWLRRRFLYVCVSNHMKKYPYKYPAVSHWLLRSPAWQPPCPPLSIHLPIWGGNRNELWTYDTFYTNIN